MTIDWSAPWLAPYRDRGEAVWRRVQGGAAVADALNSALHTDVPVRFAPAAVLPSGEAYEVFIARAGVVPTRDNLHDFFNGLVWLHHPRLKRRLNQLQAGEITRCGIGPRRGPRRDALTLLDESGALLQAPPRLVELLVRRHWAALFIEERAVWQQARLMLIGHAVLEKLVRPFKAITAHVWLGRAPLTSKPFAPLPVLGVPGWWPANEDAGFYADHAVFRPHMGQFQP